MVKSSIYSYTLQELEDYFLGIHEKAFKAKQLYRWLYDKKINSYDEITDMKKSVLDLIKKDLPLLKIELVEVERDYDVNKYLFKLYDCEHIEAVLMRHDYGFSICVSSQVGCNMGCKFCESGRRKKVRNLEVYEMVTQLLLVEEDMNDKITHVVVMGIGEPFDNYDSVLNFLKIINSSYGLQIGSRHITVSTCGIVPKIYQFMEEPYQFNLAISLHAPSNELREELMPINKVYKIEDVLSAVKCYIKKTNRRVTFEYILLKDKNDSEECALLLVKLLKGINCYVNLIPYNETESIQLARSKMFKIMKFYDILKKNKISVTIRREFGSKISAACGQLRSKKEEL